jgi:hypothetical protein
MKKSITEKELLKILDEQEEGFVAPEWCCFSKYDTISVIKKCRELVDEQILQKRDCSGLAYEYSSKFYPIRVKEKILTILESDLMINKEVLEEKEIKKYESLIKFLQDEIKMLKGEYENINNKLMIYKNHIYQVIDMTLTHYITAPLNATEGYGYIPKEESISLKEYQALFDLQNIDHVKIQTYNSWITQQGFPEYKISTCKLCNTMFFQTKNSKDFCEECENKTKIFILVESTKDEINIKYFSSLSEAQQNMWRKIKEIGLENYPAFEYKELFENLKHFSNEDIEFESFHGYVRISNEDSIRWQIKPIELNEILLKLKER